MKIINNEGTNVPETFPTSLYPEGLPAEKPEEPSFPFGDSIQSDVPTVTFKNVLIPSLLVKIYDQAEPRIIITHLPAHLLPESIKATGRFLYVTRNPKAAMTSLHFFRGEPKDGWEGTFKRFMAPNPDCPNAYGSYFDHMLHAQNLMNEIGDRGRVIYYELLKSNFEEQTLILAKWLGFELSDAKLEKVAEVSNFKNMKKEDNHTSKVILRKGVSNDWENYLDAEKWAKVDQVFSERLADCEIAKGVPGMNV